MLRVDFPFTQEGHPLKEGKLTRVSPFQNRIRIHGQEAPNKPRSATEKDVCQIMRSSAMQRLYKHCLTKERMAVSLELRKAKKDEQALKRRNITIFSPEPASGELAKGVCWECGVQDSWV